MIRRLVLPSLLLTAVCAGPAHGQAPRITPDGDPSVLSDTIYSLAVDPADHPEESAVLLLDDGVVRFEADGRSVRTFRQVIQILTAEAAENYREFSFSYSPGHERLTLNWIRVVKPNGEVISAEPSHMQESDVPAQMGDPVYSDRRVIRASLTGVEPGVIVDYSYTTDELKPFLPGDFFQTWGVTTGLAVMRSRFVVDVPASLDLRMREDNLDFARRTETVDGRTVHTWATKNVPRVEIEPFAADSNEIYMAVMVSSPMTWQGIGSWYAGNARGRYTLTPAVEAKLADVVADARTLEDSIRAVHKWVAQDIRYVSIALGLGGYQPRVPDEVVRTGFGDCKDKVTLLVTALDAMGVEAYPVLLSATGVMWPELPSLDQLDHAIAAIRRPDGYLFVDPTASLTPLGELPPAEQGEFAMIVFPDGRVEEVTLPQDPVDSNRVEYRMVGTLSSEGLLTAWYTHAAFGALQYELRSLFENPLDPSLWGQAAEGAARQFYPTASADSLELLEGKDLDAPVQYRLHIVDADATTTSGDTEILQLPFGAMSEYARMAAELRDAQRRNPRRFPIDAAKVTGDNVLVAELRLTLPVGWRARLPATVSATSVFGSYLTEYTQDGRELRMTRRFSGARGVYPPERIGELIDWLEAIGRDDATFIVLDKPGV